MARQLRRGIIGEDIPITVAYTDPADGTAVATDVAPDIVITGPAGTEEVASTAMTDVGGTGEYEYVWDTSTVADGEGDYVAEITAEIGGETNIARAVISLDE